MRMDRCPECSGPIQRGRYFGVSFWIVAVLTLGGAFLFIPWLPVTIQCRKCFGKFI